MNVLVVGGAGYIGSHMVKMLREQGHQVLVFDNLSGGYREALLGAELAQADLADRAALDDVFAGQKFDAVMHFASFIQVGESVQLPDKYYRNNVSNTINLLDAMVAHGVKRFIFSSTAAIFGEPDVVPIDESQPSRPLNPYGRSKAMVEDILADYEHAFGLRYTCLRYFNAAGADLDGQLGERHEPEDGARASRCTDAIIRRRMAPASATTFTWSTCAARICWRCSACRTAATAPASTLATVPAFLCSR
jgi:UDP-glucose 4-epimerase